MRKHVIAMLSASLLFSSVSLYAADLEQDMDTQEITLITCTPLFVGSHRLIIRGVLTEAEP